MPPKKIRLTKKKLEREIELTEEYLSDIDYMQDELHELQKEYKKRYGKEYEY